MKTTNVIEPLTSQSAVQSTQQEAGREKEITTEIGQLEARLEDLNGQIDDAKKAKRQAHDGLVIGEGDADAAGIAGAKLSALEAAAKEVGSRLETHREKLAALQLGKRRESLINDATGAARSLIQADADLRNELSAQADSLLAGLQTLGTLKAIVSERKREVLRTLSEVVPDVEALRYEDKMQGRGAQIRVEFANVLDELSARDADLKEQGFSDWNYVQADYASTFIIPNLSREAELLWGMVHDVRQRVVIIENGVSSIGLKEGDAVFLNGQPLQVVKHQ